MLPCASPDSDLFATAFAAVVHGSPGDDRSLILLAFTERPQCWPARTPGIPTAYRYMHLSKAVELYMESSNCHFLFVLSHLSAS